MSAARQFWDAIDQARHRRRTTVTPPDDDIAMGDYDDDIGDELADREPDPPEAA
jgi:hypothetical protein